MVKLREQAPAGSALDALGEASTASAAGLVGLGLVLLALVWWVRHSRSARRSGTRTPALRQSGSAPRATAPLPVATRPPSQSPVEVAATVAAVARPSIDAPRATRRASRPVVQDSAFRPSSLDVTFVEHDALNSSMMPAFASRHDQVFAAPELVLQCEPEPLPRAVDVDVLIDLPDREGPQLMRALPVTPVVSGAPTRTDIDLDLDIDSDLASPEGHRLPAGAGPAGGASEPEREIDVSVSLIQELRGLGLWSEARELAKEVVSSAYAPLDPDIATSLHKVQHGEPASGAERRKKTRD